MIVDSLSGNSDHVKKKKKRSFLQRQKRFAKRGNFGRGTQLTQDVYEYFINIMKVINSRKDDEEEMCVLASNVFHEMEGQEARYCCNQIVSRVVENLLQYSSDSEFSKFLVNFSKNLRPIFTDAFGSHVLQQTLIVAHTKYTKLLKEADNKLTLAFYDYILKISNFLFNNLEDFIWNTYSNAIGRTVFNILSGHPVKGEMEILNLGDKNKSESTVPHEFKLIIKNYISRIISWPHFDNLCNQQINSKFLQSLLLASKNSEESFKLIERIISCYDSSPLDLTDEVNEPFIRLLEVVLCVADTESFKKIYKMMFKKHLVDLAVSKSGNFPVQKLIMNCQSNKIFEKMFAKLSPHMEKILKAGHTGVLLALVKGCRNLGLCQGDCMSMLMQIFQTKDTRELVPRIYSYFPVENPQDEACLISLHGCLIIQELLNFKKPINVVNSLLDLPEPKLVKLLSDVKGNHITDAFVKSSTVGGKSRDRLFKKLKGHYLELGTSKYGSRSLDALWSVIGVQQKALLAEELKASQSQLCSNDYGKGFARKIYLDNFRRNKDEWIKLQKTSETAEKYFGEIIPSKKRKKS